MQFDWYKVVNKPEFEALNLVSRKVLIDAEGRGQMEVLITIGNEFGLTANGVFLPANFLSREPYVTDGMACWLEEETGNVFLGFVREDLE